MDSGNKPTVSVILPTRNRLQLLQEAVQSVERQSLTSWELIIVDDSSTDGTREWLSSLQDPRISCLGLSEPSERCRARNAGLNCARGRFVLFLDDDDRLTEEALSVLTSALTRDEEAVACVGALASFDERGHRRRGTHPRFPLKHNVCFDAALGWCAGSGRSLMRAKLIREVGGWNEAMVVGEDQELWIRIGARGPTRFIPKVVLEQRAHPGQWRPTDSLASVDSAIRDTMVKIAPTDVHGRVQSVLCARKLLRDAHSAWTRGNRRGALIGFMVAIQTVPFLMTSPLVSPPLIKGLARGLIGTVVGSRATRGIKSVKAWLRRLFRREPGAHRRVSGAREPD